MAFLERHEKAIFSVSVKTLFQGAMKSVFFGFGKVAFSWCHEKRDFSVFEKSLFLGTMKKAIF